MCGIFAAFDFKGGGVDGLGCLNAIRTVLHRGPDNLGQLQVGPCFLAHTRLAIIGIEPSGNQPFVFGDLSMVFNGEVFNYIELREELGTLGYRFETNSDTEVVIKAFHKWGTDCFARFNGMWGLAIWDESKKELTASRDRFGQKPMFTMRRDGVVFVASELQQLVPLSDRKPDIGLIRMFLKEGTFDGGGRTFFGEIEEFPKAHFAVYDSQGRLGLQKYWDYPNGKPIQVDDAAFLEFEEMLQDSVRIRLRADVPCGVLLSGGVDSTLIAAYSRQFDGPGKHIPAFTYSSKYGDDESEYAGKVAKQLDMPLTIREQEPNAADFRLRLKKLVRHMGRGHSSAAIVSIDYLYESVAKAGIKVALDGQGADELLGGYKTYLPISILHSILTLDFRQAYASFRSAKEFGLALCFILFLRNVLPPWARSIGRRLYGYERYFRGGDKAERSVELRPLDRPDGKTSWLNGFLIRVHDIGLTNLLFYGDIVSMRHSVENRSPFMDHRLVDFVFSRSDKLKIWDGKEKYALRRLPAYIRFKEILERKKIGFNSPIKAETKAFMTDELRKSPILDWGIFTPRFKADLNTDAFSSAKFEPFLFRLYQVHLWNEIFFEESGMPVNDCDALEPTGNLASRA